MTLATLVACGGIYLAYLMYYKKSVDPDRLAEKFKPLYTFLYNRWYFDELYNFVIIRPLMAFGRFLWTFDARVVDGAVNGTAWLTFLWSDIKQWFDVWVVDGAVNGSGWLVRQLGNGLKYIQSGAVQFYALFILLVMVAFSMVKFEAVNISVSWPVLTVVFVAGVALLGLWSRFGGDKQQTADVLEGDK
jgi:NADH-quinone oxidoreductase subunit L